MDADRKFPRVITRKAFTTFLHLCLDFIYFYFNLEKSSTLSTTAIQSTILRLSTTTDEGRVFLLSMTNFFKKTIIFPRIQQIITTIIVMIVIILNIHTTTIKVTVTVITIAINFKLKLVRIKLNSNYLTQHIDKHLYHQAHKYVDY